VWWPLDGRVAHAALTPALLAYLTIAFGVLPVLVPLAVEVLGPAALHQRVGVLTTVVAAMSMLSVIRGPVDAMIEGPHIEYRGRPVTRRAHRGAVRARHVLRFARRPDGDGAIVDLVAVIAQDPYVAAPERPVGLRRGQVVVVLGHDLVRIAGLGVLDAPLAVTGEAAGRRTSNCLVCHFRRPNGGGSLNSSTRLWPVVRRSKSNRE
jgi:hypothetical protein